MVVNLGTNDEYFIFRGQDGKDFLRGLAVDHREPVRIILPNGRRVNGTIHVTRALTLCLEHPANDLSDDVAKLVFDLTIERYLGREFVRHGRR